MIANKHDTTKMKTMFFLITLVMSLNDISIKMILLPAFTANAKLKIVDEADTPKVPTSPNVTRNTIIAFLGGLILALIISFVRDFLDVKIKYNEEMTTILDLPILAAIPDFEYFSNQKNANKYGNRYGK